METTQKGPLRPFYYQLVNLSVPIQTHVHASSYRLSLRFSVLVPSSPLGSIRIMLFIISKNSSREEGLLLSLRIKELKVQAEWGQLLD